LKPTRFSIVSINSRASRLRHRPVQPQRLLDLVADGVHRRERGHRLLEDHADAPAAQRPDLLALGGSSGDVDRTARRPGSRNRISPPVTPPARGSNP
jgi:hypothetical protein